MKDILYKFHLKHIPIILFVWIVVLKTPCYAQTTVVQVKTYDKELKPFSNLSFSLDGENYLTTNDQGSIITKLNSSLLPPKIIYFANGSLEAESWNYSQGVLEIVVRRKTYENYTLTLYDTLNQPVENVSITLTINGKTYTEKSNENGLILFVLPVNSSIKKSNLAVKEYTISDLSQDGKNLRLQAFKTPVIEKPLVVNKQASRQQGTLNYLDSIKSLTEFYSYIKKLDLAKLNEDEKAKIDSKFKDLMLEFKDSLGVDETFNGRISDTSMVNEDIVFLTEQAFNESEFIKENRSRIDESFRLINDKLADGGTNIGDDERKKILSDIDNLGKLLNANELLFSRNQANYKAALEELKNKLLNINNLEKRLSESELQRLEERKAFRRQILIYISIIIGLVVLILLFGYFVRKFNQQRKSLSDANLEIQRINDNLENLVAQKTESLVKTNQELDTFLYHTSHKLKAPITTIIGLSYVAKLTLNSKENELFEKATETAGKMGVLLDKLAMVNEINQPHSFFKTIDINYIINKICNQYAEFVKNSKVKIKKELPNNVQFYTNPTLFEIIFTNLIENALYFSSFTSKSPEVRFKVEEDNGFLNIYISDNGEGVSEEIKDKIWNMFYIGNIQSKGNGLGLYISRRAVEALNGTISFLADKENYTTFVVKLPIQNKKL